MLIEIVFSLHLLNFLVTFSLLSASQRILAKIYSLCIFISHFVISMTWERKVKNLSKLIFGAKSPAFSKVHTIFSSNAFVTIRSRDSSAEKCIKVFLPFWHFNNDDNSPRCYCTTLLCTIWFNLHNSLYYLFLYTCTMWFNLYYMLYQY